MQRAWKGELPVRAMWDGKFEKHHKRIKVFLGPNHKCLAGRESKAYTE